MIVATLIALLVASIFVRTVLKKQMFDTFETVQMTPEMAFAVLIGQKTYKDFWPRETQVRIERLAVATVVAMWVGRLSVIGLIIATLVAVLKVLG